jgi:hypothetical protein
LAGDLSGSATFTNLGNATLTATLTKDPTITLTGDVTGSGTMTNLGDVSFATTIAANSVALGTDTTGNYVASLSAGALIDVGAAGEGATPSIAVDLSELTDGTGAIVGTEDEMVYLDNGSQKRKLISEIAIGQFSTANQIALSTDTTGNYVQQGATSGNGISGSVNSEGGTFTVTSNATNANTASTIVFRDGSGNFSAGIITATATQARYADLAEMYAADGDIEAGTVVHFAGEGKLAACDQANHHAVAGIISTDPAYLMNKDQEGVALAISGRVPCKVTGVVNAGDLMVSAGNGMAMANNSPAIGTVIGKAIESNAGGEAVIEVLAMMM